ncbi:programmed cell death protein 1 isoform X3 [Phascolarctos cinereus]|uniref:Programmed cell death protein 1 isoform X3 n=1 Tax=Phascolarctos cinereus TaxID=38626 RepID=A0A6P5KI59_PHACI|nr:programmed cell death protein 1 isoform X3 [Phascolarctos cinereus]
MGLSSALGYFSGHHDWHQKLSPLTVPSFPGEEAASAQRSLCSPLPRPLIYRAVKTQYSLGFWPLQLSRAEGENATFVCNVSHRLQVPILNWYREKNGSQPEKLAAYPKDTPSSHLQARYHIAMREDKQTYEMTILGLQMNDSGRYFCGIINFEMPPVEESNRSELTVTGAGKSESNKDSLALKKAEPSVASVSTVVYGQLDFQRTEVPKQGGAGSGEQTEYATIIFPAEKSAFYGSSPHRK